MTRVFTLTFAFEQVPQGSRVLGPLPGCDAAEFCRRSRSRGSIICTSCIISMALRASCGRMEAKSFKLIGRLALDGEAIFFASELGRS